MELAVFAVLGLFVLLFLYRRGSKAGAQLNTKHREVINDLSLDEVVTGYTETLVGIASAGIFMSSVDKVHHEVEIARSLYTKAMDLMGDPITVGQSTKLLRDLTRLGIWSLRNDQRSITSGMSQKIGPLHIDYVPSELEDRTRLNAAMDRLSSGDY